MNPQGQNWFSMIFKLSAATYQWTVKSSWYVTTSILKNEKKVKIQNMKAENNRMNHKRYYLCFN